MAERILSERISDIRRIAKAHGITRVRVFGSRAAGVAGSTSDLDMKDASIYLKHIQDAIARIECYTVLSTE